MPLDKNSSESAFLLSPKKSVNSNQNNKISKYITIIAFSTLAVLWHKSSINATQINIKEKKSNQNITSPDIISWLLSIESNEIKLIDKSWLDELYRLFDESLLPENTKKYIREVLLNTYINMLKNWYNINWYEELDQLREKNKKFKFVKNRNTLR